VQVGVREPVDDGKEVAVHGAENPQVVLPGPLGGVLSRADEPVAARHREPRLPLLPRVAQAAQNDVLPIGRVNGQLPDIVPLGAGPPRRLLRREAAKRTPQVGAVPGLALIGLLQGAQEHLDAWVVCHRVRHHAAGTIELRASMMAGTSLLSVSRMMPPAAAQIPAGGAINRPRNFTLPSRACTVRGQDEVGFSEMISTCSQASSRAASRLKSRTS